MGQPKPTAPQWESSDPQRAGFFLGAVVYIPMIALLFFVQLPLLWMIITAFKVEGTAFRFEFIPKTTLSSPPRSDPPYRLPLIAPDQYAIHVEYTDPAATTVDVVVKQTDQSTQRYPMSRTPDGVWFDIIGPVKSDVAYAISVNGEKTIPDPRSEWKAAEDGFTRPKWKAPGVAIQGSPRILIYSNGNELIAQWTTKPGRNLAIETAPGRIEDLRETQPGQYEFLAKIPYEKTYRFLEHRSLGQAIASMYTSRNFKAILTSPDFNFGRYFLNSLVVATSAGFLTVLLCMLGGYAFSQKRFHFRETLFALLLSSMLVPGMIYMVPQFAITLRLGWMNTYQGMVIPHLGNVFGLFLLRQYISQIPGDLFDAARIDGATEPRILRHIVFPLCLPIMLTLFLLVFVGQWSNFLWQLIINTADSPVLTLPVGLQQFKGQFGNDWEKIMAGACFSILPVAALFLALQRYFILGLTAGAVKE